MSDQVIPNLAALLAALLPGSPGAQAAAAFDAVGLSEARERLRVLVATWEQALPSVGDGAG
jgi:hypothetical protein